MRTIARLHPSTRTLEGGGFPVRRPFPTRGLDHIDPFLLLDEMGPLDAGPGEAVGAPDHPHRGFETVTYLLAGRFEHKDSSGSAGQLGPGDVQWMTAGSGVVHAEMPEAEFRRTGGRLHGFQLWVNLPRDKKMIAPRYQDVRAAEIPEVALEGANVRVIAGSAGGARSPVETGRPILYLHVALAPGARLVQPIERAHHAIIYPFDGAITIAGREVPEGFLAITEHDGENVEVSSTGGAQFLLLAAEPIGEPVVRYGPFVMNSEAEIAQAIDDFRRGRMGTIA